MNLETNKILAAILIAAIIVMVTDKLATELVHPHSLEQNAYQLADVGSTSATTTSSANAAPVGPSPAGPLLAAASVEDGMKLIKKCTACHTVEQGGPNRVGPNLWNIVNMPVAHHAGFAYSDGMKTKGGTWSYENLNQFLFKPKSFVPGTKMNFAGLSKDTDRANLIKYLRSLSPNPAPLP